jgi:putative two-component system response regulator
MVNIKPTVLIVDDSPENLALLGELLDTTYRVRVATSGIQALSAVQIQPPPDLILLDLMMPGMDGYEVLKHLKTSPVTAGIPVIFVTAKDAHADEERGLKLGAVDYVSKPVNPTVLLARVAVHIELKQARDTLANHNAKLEAEVARRVKDILIVQDVSIRALASLGEARDTETGHHIRRTQLYIDVLGRHLQNHPRFKHALTPDRLNLIVNAAPLHDIGKIGIRDEILLKPGKLTEEEFTIMKTHAELGGDAIDRAIREVTENKADSNASYAANLHVTATSAGPLEFLEVAREIAAGHHEKWNGTGYPNSLREDAIPVSARLMALADVFDALISRRVYKNPMPLEDVLKIIREGSGTHFDPDIVEAFFATQEQFTDIAAHFSDTPH